MCIYEFVMRDNVFGVFRCVFFANSSFFSHAF